jgi:2-iminobutanoate/2-iminopropanoate deaminase
MARSIEVPGLAHNAPIPQAARVGPLLCTSAISGKDRATGELPVDGQRQVELAFANLEAVLAAGGARLSDVAKLSIVLADNSLREAVNGQWSRCFPDPQARPARHIQSQALQHGMLLQLECIAYVVGADAATR